MKKAITLFFSLFLIVQLQANNFWADVTTGQINLPEDSQTNQMPNQYRTLSLDFMAMVETLRTAPMENTNGTPLKITLPLPNGQNEVFEVYESPVMAPGLAEKYSQRLRSQPFSSPRRLWLTQRYKRPILKMARPYRALLRHLNSALVAPLVSPD